MRIRYFAWLKHRVGLAEEVIDPPPEVATIAALKLWLGERHPGFADSFGEPGRGALCRQPGVCARGWAAAGRRRGGVLPAGDRRLR